jgi:Podovirus DNA encapsidation protein (Gp16).
MAFYSLDKINSIGAQYNFLLGGRGCGKTYAVIKQAIEHYFETGEPSAYIRRYKESIAPSKVSSLLKPHYGLIE